MLVSMDGSVGSVPSVPSTPRNDSNDSSAQWRPKWTGQGMSHPTGQGMTDARNEGPVPWRFNTAGQGMTGVSDEEHVPWQLNTASPSMNGVSNPPAQERHDMPVHFVVHRDGNRSSQDSVETGTFVGDQRRPNFMDSYGTNRRIYGDVSSEDPWVSFLLARKYMCSRVACNCLVHVCKHS
jgi:hypothetical protein